VLSPAVNPRASVGRWTRSPRPPRLRGPTFDLAGDTFAFHGIVLFLIQRGQLLGRLEPVVHLSTESMSIGDTNVAPRVAGVRLHHPGTGEVRCRAPPAVEKRSS
jgi:hypothetical protein